MSIDEERFCVSLKEYMERRFDANDKSVAIAMKELERRLHELNEWRKETLSERRELTPIALHDRLQQDVLDFKTAITTRLGNSETRYLTIVAMVGIFLTAITIVLHVFTK